MGGDAAKERRRLKRLQAQQAADGKAAPTSSPKTSPPASTSEGGAATKGNKPGAKMAEFARHRLQRKLARKAAGKFKPHAGELSPSKLARKRTQDEAEGGAPRSAAAKMAKRGPRDRNQPSNRSGAAKGKEYKGKTHHHQKGKHWKEKVPTKKNQPAKHKAKKPKHLKRKMEQLSTTLAEGNASGIAELEGQMKKLAEQMEEMRRLKDKAAAVEKKKPVADPKEGAGPEDAADNVVEGSQEEVKEEQTREEKEGSETSISESSASDDDGSVRETSPKDEEAEGKQVTESGSSDDDDDSSSDEDELAEPSNARSRGKRRRGRREGKAATDATQEKDADRTAVEADESSPAEETADAPSSKKTSKKEDRRRCIGRKPVTDYAIGQTYPGTVKYIKPKLGAFLDIGSHSDAFCHISNLSDDYVANVEDVVKVDDAVENARVIEIDRERKRITVSLRSEEGAAKEQERLESTRRYERNSHPRGMHGGRGGGRGGSPKTGYVRFDSAKSDIVAKSPTPNQSTGLGTQRDVSAEANVDLKRERKLARRAERRAKTEHTDTSTPAVDLADGTDGGMGQSGISAAPNAHNAGPKSGADLKRERKLARRAERRAALEAANGNA